MIRYDPLSENKCYLKAPKIQLHVHTLIVLLVMVFSFYFTTDLVAQRTDSTFSEKVNANKTVKKAMGFITREPEVDKPVEINSEDPYLKYEGKIIRHIIVKRIGFEQTVLDTTQVIRTFISNAANTIHSDTRESVIRNYLFIKEGKPLNPFRVADNERTIRSLDFVLDARIHIKVIKANPDSVDLLVITRDVFSLAVSVKPKPPKQFNVGITDINVAGLGQRVEYRQIFNTTRSPHFGYEFLYKVANIGGTFIDATAAYTQLDHGVSIGNENERSFYFKLNRDLYQPFARLAGGIELSDNISRNVNVEPDSTFIQYHYKTQDYWAGYSFGYKRMPNNLRENRNRKFVALRIYEQHFLNQNKTNFSEQDEFAYRDKIALLTQVTFFRQDFYKTQYVLGFGRTEDIPYGYRVSFTGGLEKESGLNRPYLGGEFYHNKILKHGTILTYAVKAGNYWYRRGIEDGLFSLNFKRYSRIRQKGNIIFRNQFEAGYAILFNQHLKRGVNVRDLNGIVGFKPDSLVGTQRITLSQETIGFTPWKILGFRLAPIARVDVALIKVSTGMFRSRNFFTGFSLGIRARNENLIFNTIEARLFYYPEIVERVNHFHFTITTNFRIKYPSNLVNKPATVFP
jgi:hypothetical protein